MDDAMEQESDVGREIDVLRTILSMGIPGAPLLNAYLETALATLESEGAFPKVEASTGLGDAKNDRPLKESGRSTGSGSLDSLGGGNIL
ncbi:hypothetical protein ACCD00_01660 [Pseudomonas sp. Pseusp3]|uniref:hypothetical protein n=1 Tax=Pseudomonas sp. Pseusp3 TaxID=3243029 RepID=UPI0039B00E97